MKKREDKRVTIKTTQIPDQTDL